MKKERSSIKSQLNKCLNNRSGVTMIELVITIILIGLFATGICQIMASSIQVYTKLRDTQTAVQVSDTILEKIAGEIERAQQKNQAGEDNIVITNSTGDVLEATVPHKTSGGALICKDWSSNEIQIDTRKDEENRDYLNIYYAPISNPEGEQQIEGTNWKFDKKTYMDFYIESLTFDFPGAPDYDTYANNVVHISLKLKNTRGISYSAERYVGCYNLADNEPFANNDLREQTPDEEPIDGIALLYYEFVDGKFYYSGGEIDKDNHYKHIQNNGGLCKNVGSTVSEEGYLLCIPKNLGDIDEFWTSAKPENEFKDNNKPYSAFDDARVGQAFNNEMKIYTLSTGKENGNWKDSFKDKDGTVYIQTKSGRSASFGLSIWFGDSVKENASDSGTYYIRSFRQLNNLADNDLGCYAKNEKNEFVQNIDIDCGNNSNNTITEITAKFHTENSNGYVINGIKNSLFQDIKKTEIKGITLTNIKVEGVGFAKNNEGTIDSCSIRSDARYAESKKNSYGNVVISKATAGFIDRNTGLISNCFIVGTVSGQSASGFVRDNVGSIFNCYANNRLTGKCGFVDSNNNGTIHNCHVLGTITGIDNNTSGFCDYSSGDMQNCYTALNSITTQNDNQLYFFGRYYNGTNDMNYYLAETEYNSNNKRQGFGKEISYTDLIINGTNSVVSHPYGEITNNNGMSYPFDISSTEYAFIPMQHWGDWPKEP